MLRKQVHGNTLETEFNKKVASIFKEISEDRDFFRRNKAYYFYKLNRRTTVKIDDFEFLKHFQGLDNDVQHINGGKTRRLSKVIEALFVNNRTRFYTVQQAQ